MFGTMVDYWAYTGDETYVNVTYQALQSQIGDDADFMPTNQTKTEGNDEYAVSPIGPDYHSKEESAEPSWRKTFWSPCDA